MGITITAPTVESTVRIVCTEDPDVETIEGGGRGWVQQKDAIVRAGADVLEVVPLNVDQRAACMDAGGIHQSHLAACRSALKSVNGDPGREARNAFLESCDSGARFLLGRFILAISSGEDPQESQGRYFRAYERLADG